MNFDRLYRSILKERQESSEETLFVLGSVAGTDVIEPPLERELQIEERKEGSIAITMLEIMERALEIIRKHDIPTPEGLTECYTDMYTDNIKDPKAIYSHFGWLINEDEDLGVHIDYKIISSRLIPKDNQNTIEDVNKYLFNTQVHSSLVNITLDQLKQMVQKEITDSSMKGHDFEDLYNL